MSLISFKNIKLFKTPAFAANHERGTGPAAEEDAAGIVRRILRDPIVFAIVFALLLAYFVSYIPASKALPELKAGEIAPQDIVVPAAMTLEDTETTESRRRDAEDAVLPVYALDANVALNTGDKIRQFFASGREWLKTGPKERDALKLQIAAMDRYGLELSANAFAALEKESYGADLETALIGLLEKSLNQGIILSKSLFIHKEDTRGFLLVQAPNGEKVVRPLDVLDMKETKDKLAAEIAALDLPPRKKTLLVNLADGFLAPNIIFNKVETEARKETARAGVEAVYYDMKKGKVLIRKGDEATEDVLKQIRVVNRALGTKRPWLAAFIGTFLLFSLLLITLWFYLRSLLDERTAFKYLHMMGLTLALSFAVTKTLVFLAGLMSQSAKIFLLTNAESYRFAFPYQFGVILFAFLTSNPVALIYAILNSLLVGYLFNANYFLMIYSLIGGLAAIYGIKVYKTEKRTAALRAGIFLVAPLNLFVILTLHLIRERFAGIATFAADAVMALAGGLFSAALAFLFLPVFENLFRFLTQTKLLELTNTESELFRQLAIAAPGSYHHSLLVASLAEKAAEAIRLNPLLVRAGALYHDVGKIKMPEYFIENKTKRVDAHKDLTPSMSTLVIINHVKEGLEIARKEKLPRLVRDIIEQHHGNSLVRYFYQKAKDKVDPEMEKIGEESYRYPGPPPQSKEAAVVMLADSIEAASRSLKVHKEENYKRVIKDIFDSYLQDGQLDDCAFSMKELRTIAATFLSSLTLIYQPRVDYPGFDFENKKKKKAEKRPPNGHDRNPESPDETPD